MYKDIKWLIQQIQEKLMTDLKKNASIVLKNVMKEFNKSKLIEIVDDEEFEEF